MAYIVDRYEDISDGDTESFEVSLPEEYEANDLIIIFVSQDKGTTAFSIDNSNWTELFQRQSDDGTRLACYYKIAQSDNEDNFTVTGYNAADWAVVSLTIRDIDTSSPIDTYALEDHKGEATPTSPSITLNYNNELILYALENDTSRFNWGNFSQVRYAGKARSLGTCLSISMRWSETKSDFLAIQGIKEDASQGGNFATVAIRSSSETTLYKEYNPNLSGSFIEMFGYTSTTTFDATNSFASTILGVSTDATQPTISHTKISIADYGYCTIIDNTDTAPSSDTWQGIVHDFGTNQDFTSGTGTPQIISLFMAENSTYYRKISHLGVILGFKDANGNWAVYDFPRKILKGYVPSSVIIDLDKITPDDSYGTIDWTQIRYMILAHHRNPKTDQEAKIYFRHLMLWNRYEIFGGSSELPIISDKITTDFLGWQLFDLMVNVSGAYISGVPIKIAEQDSYIDFSKTFITPNNKGYIKLADQSLEYNFNPTYLLSLKQALLNSPINVNLSITGDTNTDVSKINLDGISIINHTIDLSFQQDITLKSITLSDSDLYCNTSNITLDTITGEDTKVFIDSLTQVKNGNFIQNERDDYAFIVSGTGDMTFDCKLSGYNKAVHFTATSGTIDVYLTVNASTFNYDSDGVTIEIHQPQITLKLTNLIIGSEVRIYKKSDMSELTGVENVSENYFVYSYEYIEATEVIIVIFNINYDPIRIDTILTNENKEIPIQQTKDRVFENP